jgi:hypothetical protein
MKARSLLLIFVCIIVALSMGGSGKELNILGKFIPSGWMGDTGDISYLKNYNDSSRDDSTCIEIKYSAAGSNGEGWAGIYWQYPENNWGEKPGRTDLVGATKLTFWARGALGGEKAEFKVGGISNPDKPHSDSIEVPATTDVIVLSNDWTEYTIDLAGQDLSNIIGGFCWVTNTDQNPNGCTIYLDDIKYVW